MDDPFQDPRSHDELCPSYDLTHAVYGAFPIPSRALDVPLRRSRATSTAECASKRKVISDTDLAPPLSIKIARSTANFSWLPQSKRGRMQNYQAELHQSTCLNLNMASGDSTESDLWILPDIDDWEVDNDKQHQATKKEGEWAPLLRRAAKSNLERLKARLEGDGWDFVGGKYGEDEKALKDAVMHTEESVDEEFDVVVLPVVKVSC